MVGKLSLLLFYSSRCLVIADACRLYMYKPKATPFYTCIGLRLYLLLYMQRPKAISSSYTCIGLKLYLLFLFSIIMFTSHSLFEFIPGTAINMAVGVKLPLNGRPGFFIFCTGVSVCLLAFHPIFPLVDQFDQRYLLGVCVFVSFILIAAIVIIV